MRSSYMFLALLAALAVAVQSAATPRPGSFAPVTASTHISPWLIMRSGRGGDDDYNDPDAVPPPELLSLRASHKGGDDDYNDPDAVPTPRSTRFSSSHAQKMMLTSCKGGDDDDYNDPDAVHTSRMRLVA
eukprot:CAMPEP_0173387202 /NCGR_PEP_ID=MMETSP1356-20130122/9719_1 /TAXON_ID=77927 ORGANISM="Hemiselmis virescens, Strain PCC157" /NCGR_SAMPLE_ID=MMETSP1356 /ASSEMBLY_ACC=CAM_ASM_000847 /LENGTH=129 /DNA_ID=CAMNT_0014343725 /DNA_START=87 /DNA_END=476 /DNA_ORIENTATION=-